MSAKDAAPVACKKQQEGNSGRGKEPAFCDDDSLDDESEDSDTNDKEEPTPRTTLKMPKHDSSSSAAPKHGSSFSTARGKKPMQKESHQTGKDSSQNPFECADFPSAAHDDKAVNSKRQKELHQKPVGSDDEDFACFAGAKQRK